MAYPEFKFNDDVKPPNYMCPGSYFHVESLSHPSYSVDGHLDCGRDAACSMYLVLAHLGQMSYATQHTG